MAKKKAKKASVKKSAKKKPAKKTAKKPAKKAPTQKVAKKKPASSKSVGSTLSIGQLAPDFQLQNESGQIVRLSDFRGKPVVLYFYPKDDTPGCTKESCDFRDNYARVRSVGAEVFGISRDDVHSHSKFKNKYSLPFSLLADSEGKVTEAYGVWKEKSMYGRKYMGIERTTFIVDADGTIKKIYPKVSVTGHVDQVLADLASEGADA